MLMPNKYICKWSFNETDYVVYKYTTESLFAKRLNQGFQNLNGVLLEEKYVRYKKRNYWICFKNVKKMK